VSIKAVDVPDWPRPRGYANGMVCTGRAVHVAGQIGWVGGAFTTDDLAEQFGIALDNVIAVVRAAGGAAESIAEMTVYVTDLDAYRTGHKAIGLAWRARMGTHYPAMALVGVAGLVEPRAKVEIQAVAYLEG
jgi:enamine deaminase RidA (YjgF/YER057c/UK114 family)